MRDNHRLCCEQRTFPPLARSSLPKAPMPAEIFILGEDASLELSIRTMQAKLQALGFHIETPAA